MSEPPAPSWPVAASADPHRRPLPVTLACLVAGLWSLVVLVLALRFGLAPSDSGWRHADPAGLLPHGLWWRVGVAVLYATWCGLALWFAVAAYLRRRWAAVALGISAALAFLLSAVELRTVLDVPIPLSALGVVLLLGLPATRAWYAAADDV